MTKFHSDPLYKLSQRNRLAQFIRRHCDNRQRVDIGQHHVGERFIHELMALQGSQAYELGGDNANCVMTPAIARSCVTRVEMTVVD
jgi:hypothetical protein